MSGQGNSDADFLPSIEGMRAMAVLVAVLFHLDLGSFGGGYLGVDLFFVISGFIITRTILSSLQAGTFTLRDFYVRRVRRLLPALLVTILLTLLGALYVVPPLELARTARSALWATGSLVNVKFWLEAGYFDAAAPTKPLLHTWSLSLEEQFYLFWPALLLVLNTRRVRLVSVTLLLFASLAVTFHWRNDLPDAVFYLFPFRAHQLMAGALIAILGIGLSGVRGNISLIVGGAGFLLLATGFGGDEAGAINSMLVTALGSMLLLGREAPLSRRLLGNRPSQWLGARSYAVYLVHWPIIVLYKYSTDFELVAAERVLLVLMTLACAAVLHRLVEEPFRKRGDDETTMQRAALRVSVALLTLSIGAALLVPSLSTLYSPSPAGIRKMVESNRQERSLRLDAIRAGRCNVRPPDTFSDYDEAFCAALERGLMNILVLGDSIAAESYVMLSTAYPEIHFLQATGAGCPPLLKNPDAHHRPAVCRELNTYRFDELVRRDVDLIVLASDWKPHQIEPLKATTDYLQSLGKHVLVLGPRLVFGEAVPLLLSRQDSLAGFQQTLDETTNRKAELLEQMRRAVPSVEIVDVATIQCTPECTAVDGGRLLFIDERHLTGLGARRLGERFRRVFDLPGLARSGEPTWGSTRNASR